MKEMEEKYVVLQDIEYYGGNCQHPDGWELRIETDGDGRELVGSLEDCKDWMDEITDRPTYLSHGMAGYTHRIARVVDDNATYQDWLDLVDWEGCPGDPDDYDDNCQWAATRAYETDDVIYIDSQTNSGGYIVDLNTDQEDNL